MSYVHKLIEKDEDLVGVATLHWIYILKGMGWFFMFAAIGWAFDALMTRGLYALADISNMSSIPASLSGMSNWVMMFFLAVGFLMFAFHVVKVISTHIALTNRRIIHKRGLIFVKVEQIDLEEIRGENLDLGWFGRFLGYAYIDLDCRFIGDVKLDAIEQPERFIRALHHLRANTQDALNVMLGKGNTIMPMNLVGQNGGQQQTASDDPNKQQPAQPEPARPEIEPQPTQPEIQPPQTPTEIPAPPNEPMPTQPPPLNQDQQAGQTERGRDVPHNDRQKMIDQEAPVTEAPKSKGQVQHKAQVQEQAAQVVEQVKQGVAADEESAPSEIAPEIVEQVVQQVTPQIAKEVVRQMEEQGLVSHNDNPAPAPDADNQVDNDLIHVFDDAALTKDGKKNDPDPKDQLGYAIH